MGRKPNPARRGELLAAAAAYLEEHGLAGLSLRPLAASLGVSPRTLLYHFGSKERLVTEVVLTLQEGLEPPEAVAAAAEAGSAAELRESLLEFWRNGTQPGAEPFMRLFLDVLAAALRDPDAWRGFVDAAVPRWHELVAAALARHGYGRDEALEAASELVALNYGLAIDLLATGDRARTGRTMERALARLEER
jgi:AcrR family transcriptional regulator